MAYNVGGRFFMAANPNKLILGSQMYPSNEETRNGIFI